MKWRKSWSVLVLSVFSSRKTEKNTEWSISATGPPTINNKYINTISVRYPTCYVFPPIKQPQSSISPCPTLTQFPDCSPLPLEHVMYPSRQQSLIIDWHYCYGCSCNTSNGHLGLSNNTLSLLSNSQIANRFSSSITRAKYISSQWN